MSPRKKTKPKKKKSGPKKKKYLLDILHLEAVQQGKEFGDFVLRCYWNLYSELIHQRSAVIDQINKWALSVVSGPFSFSDWRRLVKYKFSNDPLSVLGSLGPIGGRFNIGDIDPSKFPKFPALYIASDQSTSFLEVYGRSQEDNREMSVLDLSLAKSESYTNISVKGVLTEVIDIRDKSIFDEYVKINRSFTLSKGLIADFNKIGGILIPQTVTQFYDSIMASNWRLFPSVLDVPSNSQILGQMISENKIQGILYRSAAGTGDCLAIYPQNFQDSDSCIEVQDESPNTIVRRRLDSSNSEQICKSSTD